MKRAGGAASEEGANMRRDLWGRLVTAEETVIAYARDATE